MSSRDALYIPDDIHEPHAVRWAPREVRHEMQWTRWHGTDNGIETWCGRRITLAHDGGSFLPEEDFIDAVDCQRCLARRREKGTGDEKTKREAAIDTE